MTSGSVTSIGVAYPRETRVADLARHLAHLLGRVLLPAEDGKWSMGIGGGPNDAWVEREIGPEDDQHEALGKLEGFLGSEHGELRVRIDIEGIGIIDGIVRPETTVCGLLLDLPDAELYPERDRSRRDLVPAAARRILLDWYDASRFAVGFADHEAEFEEDPLKLTAEQRSYAILALPSRRADGPPLEFHEGGWRLSPLGA